MTRYRLVVNAVTGESETVAFSAEEEAAADAADAAAAEAATNPANFPLSDRQLRLGLIAAGVLPSAVRAGIEAAITDALEREAALTWFDYSKDIHWDHPETQQLMARAGFSEEQAAAMWMAAKDIPA